MIVVSGVLVLVALVFLIIGLFQEGLGFIWASIITSVVAGVFLLLGALQRRGTPAAAVDTGTTGTDMLERVTAVSVRSRDEATADDADTEAGEPAVAAGAVLVSVVPNRPRYHTASCRFLAGRSDVEQVPVGDAQGQGYTACGVCKPDAAIAAAAAESPESPEPPAAEQAADDVDAADDTAAIDTTGTAVAATTGTRARKAPAKKAAAAGRATSRTRATAGSAAGGVDSADDAGAGLDSGTDAGDTAAAPAKSTRAAKGTATKAAAKSTAGGTNTVVVVPDRGKYHVETCRFVQNAPGAITVSKTTAKRQGYVACGVCKPS